MEISNNMQVVKRNGKREDVNMDKIGSRIKKMTYGLDTNFLDWFKVAQRVVEGLYPDVTTRELDELAAETAAALTTEHPDYSMLAARLAITAHQKETEKSFSKNIEKMYKYVHPKTGKNASIISEDVYKVVKANASVLDAAIVYDRDFLVDYFGFKTLQRSYFLKIDEKPVERIQQMWMRVAVGIWGENIAEVLKTYELLSTKFGIHATPTLFNAGTPRNQMSSCFLAGITDSIEGMYSAIAKMAQISKFSGGLGVWAHDIRSRNSYVRGTNGTSNGLIPYLRTMNEMSRHVDQSGKRKGSIAVYLEPWHPEVFDFIDIKKGHGKEEMRARDLFPALWVSNLFFDRLENEGDWSLFNPDEAPGLSDVYDEPENKAFTELYEKYEAEGRAVRVVKAKELWEAILDSLIETGTPYMLNKDAFNAKSNQKNIGIIKSSNLCTEIAEVSVPDEEIAVCNLASTALPMYWENGAFNHKKLFEVIYQLTKNLNRVIDINFYPVEDTRRSNMRHRPIGLGVQGLADLLAMAKLSFEDAEALVMQKDIFETIYFASLTASNDLAKIQGPYETFAGSPASKGILQFDMWSDVEIKAQGGKLNVVSSKAIEHSGNWDWDSLRDSIIEFGLANSLLVAPMPTASTAQILGNNESFEPYGKNITLRKVLSGEFIVVNKHLVKELVDLGLWSINLKDQIVADDGSVQKITSIPAEMRRRYKTVYEVPQRTLVDMAAARGAYIDQSQSFNLHFEPDMEAQNLKKKISMTLLYGHKKGLKTLSYYVRTRAVGKALKGLGNEAAAGMVAASKLIYSEAEKAACVLDDPEGCEACGA